MSRSSWLNKTTRLALFLRGEFTCTYCLRQPPVVRMSLDHLDPKGGNTPENLIVCCIPCNSSRKQQSVHAFCAKQGLPRHRVYRHIKAQVETPLAGYQHVARQLSKRGYPRWVDECLAGAKTGTPSPNEDYL